ncbi:ribonucleotide reductase subunit 1 [Saimiriine alphaherpesvirus 1]|uniref:Ribonucleoside-diphosphate reductase large subunit n=1 Tax=Saimiriine herpesvirus 1 (strain MV-5-4-PSL) TaxID=10353 RepID=E2IUD0_SHV1|nr:ribonucleotide reductase subunit 1 [Saimiriine alphaherpesvirus 1]ADO13788.1 ribonucleotide reductase subunit 1 [Saimiriine alphaherpesvirus 1]
MSSKSKRGLVLYRGVLSATTDEGQSTLETVHRLAPKQPALSSSASGGGRREARKGVPLARPFYEDHRRASRVTSGAPGARSRVGGGGTAAVVAHSDRGGRTIETYVCGGPDSQSVQIQCTNSCFIQCGSNSTMIATGPGWVGGRPVSQLVFATTHASCDAPGDPDETESSDAGDDGTTDDSPGSLELADADSDESSRISRSETTFSDSSALSSARTSNSFVFCGSKAGAKLASVFDPNELPQTAAASRVGDLESTSLNLCLDAANNAAIPRGIEGTFEAPTGAVSLRMAATLREVLLATRDLGLSVPPFPADMLSPRVFAEYVTRVVNSLKPRVRRSGQLYLLLGRLVHLRIETKAGSFRRWMESPDIDLDPTLKRDLRVNERALCEVLGAFAGGAEYALKNRGLQSALKYEEFYLRPWGNGRLESVSQMYTRIAGALATGAREIPEIGTVALGRTGEWIDLFAYFFDALVSHAIVPSTPAMLYLGGRQRYTSSCYLVNPQRTDSAGVIDAITHNVGDILARHGGIGLSIQSFNGGSSVMPALKLLDSLVAAHNAGSHRPTGVCVYLEPWHTDVMAVLRMRGLLAGEEARRCDNIFSAMWMPDLFFKRLIRYMEGERGVMWTLFDGAAGSALSAHHGAEFERLYEKMEEAGGSALTRLPIQDLAFAIVRSAASTGSPFVMFKDACNRHYLYDTQGSAISCSNLCTEIVHPADARSSGVCNLASVNLAECVEDGAFSFERLRRAVRACVLMVNVMIDTTRTPNQRCQRGHDRLRSMGIGMQGLHTACLRLGLDMSSPEFRELNAEIAEVMLLAAMQASNDLCVAGLPPFADFKRSVYSEGRFHWEGFAHARPKHSDEWARLRQRVVRHGLRNSQFIALMPTVSSSQVSESSEGFAPVFTNMFSKVGRAGETLRPNLLLLEAVHEAFGGAALERALDRLEDAQWCVARAFPCLAPDHPLRRFKTAFEYDQTLLIDLCADRAPYVDHSQSMTLYVTEASDGTLPASALTRLLVHAYKRGLKTGMYYCKVRKATNSGVFGGSEDLVCTSCVL